MYEAFYPELFLSLAVLVLTGPTIVPNYFSSAFFFSNACDLFFYLDLMWRGFLLMRSALAGRFVVEFDVVTCRGIVLGSFIRTLSSFASFSSLEATL